LKKKKKKEKEKKKEEKKEEEAKKKKKKKCPQFVNAVLSTINTLLYSDSSQQLIQNYCP
jgi:hypothetical protein